jgi:NAD(P)-dependent dehydrogenase (short-subunit alcohol dehydrogenase family)
MMTLIADSSLDGRIAVITGATGGLGPAVIEAFLHAGAIVVGTSRRQQALDALGADLPHAAGRFLAIASDVTDPESLANLRDRVASEVGPVDILVNLAGGFRGGSVLTSSPTTLQALIDLNAASVLLACQAFVPPMVERGYGRVVNVGARSALRASRNNPAYAASKSAVLRLTEALSEEVRRRGVNVNAVLPSTIDTADNRRAMPNADPSDWVPPQEIAAVIRFLASDAARAIHGAAIPVYGPAG